MRRRTGYDPKRRVAPAARLPAAERVALAARAVYTGSPAHKRIPGDFGLTPPSSPRPGATLCDEAGIRDKATAEGLLRDGLTRGVFSEQFRSGWPQNIWSVHDGIPFEAELENQERGTYHGYPMQHDDDFRSTILAEWEQR